MKASVAMNPFARIEPHHWIKYAGMVVAIDLATGDIVGSELTEAALDTFMDEHLPQIRYAQLCFPEGEDAVRGTQELANRSVENLAIST